MMKKVCLCKNWLIGIESTFLKKHKIDAEYIRFPLVDSASFKIGKYFLILSEIIDAHLKKKHRILVHCTAGISRSATIVAAYLMWKRQWSASIALDFIQTKRPIICPNIGFIKALIKFET